MTKRAIDHLVYAVSNLEEAVLELEEVLGVKAVLGGHHPTQGTKNALIKLQGSYYLELLATDDTNTLIAPPRWMGVDMLTKNQITRWSLRADHSLATDSTLVRAYDNAMGTVARGSRKTTDGSLLKWELVLPLPSPEVEVVPFMIDWSTSEKHPSQMLPETGCELLKFYATHPNPEPYEQLFEQLGIRDFVIKKDKDVRLKAIIKSPKGLIEL